MAKDVGRLGFINQQKIILSRKSSVENFKNYEIPTLIISGDQDSITPSSVHKEMLSNLAFGNMVTIKNCAHLSPLDQSVAVSALLEYWVKS